MSQDAILVVGGAGYIGSHVNRLLQQRGYPTIVLDSLSTGTREAAGDGLFVHGNMGDRALVARLLRENTVSAVIHLASYIKVGESMRKPAKYYQNNVCNTLALLETMVTCGVQRLIFSSTAAVYGVPNSDAIDESHPKNPINPYGRSKWMVEQMIEDLETVEELRTCTLRYFNAAGADPSGALRFRCAHSQNLIPICLRSLQRNRAVTIYGTDYPTSDGTCLRDYVHVWDVATAHLLSLEWLLAGKPSMECNIGTGKGHSVLEVLSTIEEVTGKALEAVPGERRKGDPPILVASAKRAQETLNWKPEYPELSQMIEHAWRAMQP